MHETQQDDAQDAMNDQRQATQAQTLVDLSAPMTLFKTPGGEAYADLPLDGRTQTHPLRSSAVRHWLTLRYVDKCGRAPSKTALETTLLMLQAQAHFRSGTDEVYLRLAWHGGALYLDLHENGAVRVTECGWEVLEADEPLPIRFRRPRGVLPLPRPERGGSLAELRQFLNLPEGNEREWALTLGWLLGALHPTGPYSLLALHGEKGSAKSTTTRYLRQLVDPSIAPAPVQPRDTGDLTLKAYNNWVVAFDNMSSMPRWLSDGLCRLSTGAGDSKRELYADSDEVIFMAKRPCILNGIDELATAGDLLDRAVVVNLPVIPGHRRQSDAAMNTAFEAARPRILGALLDAIANALFHQDCVHLRHAPRMKDFAEWVTAAEMGGGLGPDWPEGTFMNAYMANREETQLLEIEASPVATAVRAFMKSWEKEHADEPWSGTATHLLGQLTLNASDEVTRRNTWPKNGKALSDRLTRDAGALRSVGIEVERAKSGSRSITLRRVVDDEQEWGQAEDIEHEAPLGAEDAEEPSFPFSSQREKEEEDAGKSASSASSAPTPDEPGEDEPGQEYWDDTEFPWSDDSIPF